MSGRRIVVTGAAQGIGKAVATRLAEDGENLVLVDRKEAELQATAAELDALSRGTVATRVADLLELDKLPALADEIDDEAPIDGLINVAGVGLMSVFAELDLAQWQRTFDINVTATFLLGRAVGERMAPRGSGRIVNMASIAGKRGSAALADYCASKAAVISLTQSMASVYGPHGVTVNAICPGLVWTPMWEVTGAWLAENVPAMKDAGLSNHDAFMASVKAQTPLQRPTKVEDIAAMVRFLLSPDANLVTGQALNVDGGIEVH
ncbi:SDR family NAD(P)-dependent oxidoreductase [Nakamurella leprariae]|uniref:SDR family oxidoreductase n=1 Tax=Nakamurella leprariae TaxID=2803911 RepID=A0A938YJQ6_9ACTN|nr:SDR family oxidoreductase [Nakamurella leprariae]MBM9469055.1 SDR family oxidoreductase [Nakamurella leprariae]